MKKETRQVFTNISIAAIGTLLAISPLVASQIILEKFFNTRINTYQPLWYEITDFENLQREKHIFDSNKGQKLTGYMYSSDTISDQKGVIILSHGYGGGGQRTYMDCTNYLCSHGYYVFAFDNTGNDESEGDGIIGFPQGIIDLDYAINYVKTLESFKKYPLMLFGHSWGGYSVSNVLSSHPEIKAVVALSGFNQTSDLIKAHARRYAPKTEEAFMPYYDTYEQSKFGKLAHSSAIDSLSKSKANVFIIHSKDDNTVPYEAGYEIFFDKYKNDSRFIFESYNYRGHGTIYYSEEGKEYTDNFYKGWNSFLKNKPTEEQKKQYIKEHINREVWNNRIDIGMFSRIVDFYNQNI